MSSSSPFSNTSDTTNLATVRLHALRAGHFTLPEEHFITPSTPGSRKTVPSLSFLIQHTNPLTSEVTRIVFDLGLRRNVEGYSEPIQRHVATRQPMNTSPDVVASLANGDLRPDDIDFVIYSHVHWDHIGTPRDFPNSTFVVGHGTLDVLEGKHAALRGSHSFFESDLLSGLKVIELPDPSPSPKDGNPPESQVGSSSPAITINLQGSWKPLDNLPAVMDVFGDGSLYIVDAPGHLPGHINLLARTTTKWVYLAGDACHDRRILDKSKAIGTWHDAHNKVCCIHADLAAAEATLERVRDLEGKGVEVILAHDVEWENDVKNTGRFFGKGLPNLSN